MAKTPGSARAHVTPVIRTAFLNALDIMQDRKGMTLSEIMYDQICEHGLLTVMDKMGKYLERVADVNVEHSGEVTSLVSVLTGLTQGAGHDPAVESEPGSVRH